MNRSEKGIKSWEMPGEKPKCPYGDGFSRGERREIEWFPFA
jgi:hypothetical protein